MTESRRPVVGVAAVIWNDRQEVLLIRRARPPRQGEWSLPGGKVEFGETLRAALLREVREETGLEIEILELIDVAEIVRDAEAPDSHYVLLDYSARAGPGTAAADSDALEARWFAASELTRLPVRDEIKRVVSLSAARHLPPRSAKSSFSSPQT